MECCICYETPDDKYDILTLECCNNSKQICKDYLNCLRTPVCPYCRKRLPNELLEQNKNIPQSMPQYYTSSSGSFAEFVESEHIIDPYSYNNSRRLRRQIRRLRYEYLQQQTRNNPFRLTSKED